MEAVHIKSLLDEHLREVSGTSVLVKEQLRQLQVLCHCQSVN